MRQAAPATKHMREAAQAGAHSKHHIHEAAPHMREVEAVEAERESESLSHFQTIGQPAKYPNHSLQHRPHPSDWASLEDHGDAAASQLPLQH